MNNIPVTVEVKVGTDSIINMVMGSAILMLFGFILGMIANSISNK